MQENINALKSLFEIKQAPHRMPVSQLSFLRIRIQLLTTVPLVLVILPVCARRSFIEVLLVRAVVAGFDFSF